MCKLENILLKRTFYLTKNPFFEILYYGCSSTVPSQAARDLS